MVAGRDLVGGLVRQSGGVVTMTDVAVTGLSASARNVVRLTLTLTLTLTA